MILIKYTLSDFKKYCPDKDKFESFQHYEKMFDHTISDLKWKYDHKPVEVDFDAQSYLSYLVEHKFGFAHEREYSDNHLMQLCWAGSIYKSGNITQTKECLFCGIEFQGRADAKYCSSTCRGKNYRVIQKSTKEERLKKLAIDALVALDIKPSDENIEYAKTHFAQWKLNQAISMKKKSEKAKEKLRKQFGLEYRYQQQFKS